MNELGADFFSYTEYDILGDVNADGEFTVSDIVLMQKWILGIPDANLENQDSADMDKNGKLNVFDLCIMKRLIAEE